MGTLDGYDPCPADREGVLDFGHGVRGRFTVNARNERVGMIESHDGPDGQRCAGSLLFNVIEAADYGTQAPRWYVVSWDPLTLEPSLLCTECGNHGFIRNGAWEPA